MNPLRLLFPPKVAPHAPPASITYFGTSPQDESIAAGVRHAAALNYADECVEAARLAPSHERRDWWLEEERAARAAALAIEVAA